MHSRNLRSHEDALRAQLSALYREVDAHYEGASCDASTECCRFGITGREPQVTSIEVALLEHAIKARGGSLPAKRRALPLHGQAERERACPLLDQHGKCSVYAARPLGCRTFFCARAQLVSAPSRRELQDFVRRLQQIAARHRRDGDRPRALSNVL